MEQGMKIAVGILFLWALLTFWPLVILFLIGLVVFLKVSSMKGKKMAEDSVQKKMHGDILEAEYTEREIENESD